MPLIIVISSSHFLKSLPVMHIFNKSFFQFLKCGNVMDIFSFMIKTLFTGKSSGKKFLTMLKSSGFGLDH